MTGITSRVWNIWALITLGVLVAFEGFAQSIDFVHLSSEDGLPIDGVSAIAQDQRGLIWLGTPAGIHHYDGNEVQAVGKEKALERSRDRVINVLKADAKNRIWCGTDDGIHVIEPVKGPRFFMKAIENGGGAGLGIVRAVSPGPGGKVWIGSSRGLYELSEVGSSPREIARGISVTATYWASGSDELYVGTQRGEVLTLDEAGNLQPVFSAGASIGAILLDHDGGLWIAVEGQGLVQVKNGEEIFRLHSGRDLPSSDVRCLLEDSKHQLWFGTKAGLCRFDPVAGVLTNYQQDPDDSRSLPTNDIRCLFEDRRKVLWVGHGRGVSRFHLDQQTFARFSHRFKDPRSISNDAVYGMLEDSRERLWIGTEGGLNLRESDGGFRHFAFAEDGDESFASDYIYVMHEASDRKLWLGTRGGGLILFDPVSEAFEKRVHDPGDPATIPHDSISAIESDNAGRLWVGTAGGGIAVFDSSGSIADRYAHSPDDPFSIASNNISDILFTREGELYIAMEDAGVQWWDPASEKFQRLDGLSSERINVLFEDSNNRLWVGTDGSGVHGYESASRRHLFHLQHSKNQLPGTRVFGLLEDRSGFIWMSTDSGLVRYHYSANEFRNFDIDDGLQSMAFHPKAFCADSGGKLYFGGIRGFNQIDANNLPEPQTANQVVLTQLEVNGEVVEPGEENPILKKELSNVAEIQLPFDQSRRIGFKFITLDYQSPQSNRYRYRMLPIEEEWLENGKNRLARYGALMPGLYTFEVQASLDGEQWTPNSATVKVRVLPPWYKTSWARALFLLGGMAWCGAMAFALQKRQEIKLQQKTEHLETVRHKAEADLANQLQRTMLVQSTSSELQHTDSESGYEMVVDRLINHYEADLCGLYAYAEAPTPILELLSEMKRPALQAISFNHMSPTHPAIQKVLSQASPVAAPDIAEDEIFSEVADALQPLGIHSILAVRTSFQGNPNGLLFLAWAEGHDWVEDDLQVIDTVATQVGVNLAHRRLALADIRQKAELDAARKKAEVANDAKSDFLAKMSHELRTPLSSILGFSEMLGQDDELSTNQRNTLDIINASGEHLLRTINDILDMSKIESGEMELVMEEFEPAELISGVAKMMGKSASLKGLTIDTEIGPIPARVQGDKVKLRQILVNLTGNAIKFTESGGITIKAMQGSANPGPAGGAAGHIPRRLHFEIVDTGPGIPGDQVGKLFKKFSQTESGLKSGKGTGLGLAISKSFVELMGGEISVRSEVGVGTIFAFEILCEELPAKADREKKRQASSGSSITKLASDSGEIRVLIAEDQPPARMLLRTILQRAGFKVFEAENGKKAVEEWQSCHPHIVFMDNEMPVMNGMDATREILAQARGERPRIVACTAHALDSFRAQAVEAGCVDFLAKPYRQEQLFELIRRHLGVEYEGLCA